jgi:hypothetical protein
MFDFSLVNALTQKKPARMFSQETLKLVCADIVHGHFANTKFRALVYLSFYLIASNGG